MKPIVGPITKTDTNLHLHEERLRGAMHDRPFIEVERPCSHAPVATWRDHRPTVRHHADALDTDLYLRIAPEPFRKRCVVGGIERVFEINRNVRNAGIDSTHSPVSAMMQAYQAYPAYDDMAEPARALVIASAAAVFGSPVIRHADGSEHDLGGQWRAVTLYNAVMERSDSTCHRTPGRGSG